MTFQSVPAIWNKSVPVAQEEFVVFCVGQDMSRIMAFRTWARHRDIGFKSLVGCYRGLMECSFIVKATDFPQVSVWTKEEESTLWVGQVDASGSRPAKLVYADGRTEDLGHLISCIRDTALQSDSWTYDPASDEYFICV